MLNASGSFALSYRVFKPTTVWSLHLLRQDWINIAHGSGFRRIKANTLKTSVDISEEK